MEKSNVIDLSKDKTSPPRELDPAKLLFFAQAILITIVACALLACFVFLRYPGSKEAAVVFEQARSILPPLVTLVLGFYFGGRHR